MDILLVSKEITVFRTHFSDGMNKHYWFEAAMDTTCIHVEIGFYGSTIDDYINVDSPITDLDQFEIIVMTYLKDNYAY